GAVSGASGLPPRRPWGLYLCLLRGPGERPAAFLSALRTPPHRSGVGPELRALRVAVRRRDEVLPHVWGTARRAGARAPLAGSGGGAAAGSDDRARAAR